DFVDARDGGGFRVIVVFVLANLQFLRTGRTREFHGGDRTGGGKRGCGLLVVGRGRRDTYLCVLQFAREVLDARIVSAERLGLEDLPGILFAGEGNVLLLGEQFDLTDFVEVQGQQALIAKIVRRLVDAGLGVGSDGEQSRVAREHGEGAAAGGRIVADEKLLRLVFGGDVHFESRGGEAELLEIGGLFVYQAIGAECRNRRDKAGGGLLVGGQRLGRGNRPLAGGVLGE